MHMIQEASRSCNHQQRLFYKVLNKVFNTYSLCHFTLFIMTQLVYLNVLISLYEFNIWLDGYIWWKFCVNSPLRNPLTDKNADVSNTYFPRCTFSHLADTFIQSDLQMRTMEAINKRAMIYKSYDKSQLALGSTLTSFFYI